MMKPKTFILQDIKVVFMVFVVQLMLFSCNNTEKKEVQQELKTVKYASITSSGGLQKKTFTGESRSGSETNLSFRMSGLITEINAKIGERVKKGKLLAKLDTKDIDLSYQQVKVSVGSSKVQMETAKSELDRVKQLYQSQSASLNDLENARNAYAGARASYESNLKSQSLQGSQYAYAQIKSPISGVISKITAEINEFAQAGSPIITMDSGDGDIELNIGVPETYISKVAISDKVEISINNKTLSGVVTEVGYSSSGSTFPVIIKLTNPGNDIRPGVPASATFSFGSDTDAQKLLSPTKAIGQDANGNFVFKLVPTESDIYTVQKTVIEIGQLTEEGFVILSGITENELVAVAGLSSLYDGMNVKLLEN
ncbi:efflux RND transporter periplasmic adaptor subunit [Aquimarina sp. MMG016]|uniref:efflux RND transporter periplasmic adaptor subunit n=1 Tax=Aquimarina sp. MMG016 TaxID=2822690 RepID=UPI001B3A4FAD|nr:efflux RND transporter periplasmic adaptor subunit [Aquimarina sp. MMG016]MBQ4821675.1 efflux RND transporter periplasmic adaptor subunit [Aquimarina sp. MMG016]